MAFFDYVELKYEKLQKQVHDYLRLVFDRSDEKISNASPYGQIVNVLNYFYRTSVIYQKRTVSNIMIDQADNIKVIRNLARIGGHNPTRSISATGTLKLKLKPNAEIDKVNGGRIRLTDRMELKNKSNGLTYSIRIGKTEEFYTLKQNYDIYLNVVQGKYETQKMTGTGEINQSYSINVSSTSNVDHFDVEVKYNDQSVSIKDGVFDMLSGERACFIRTGMNGGIDLYFGNGDFGFIPQASTIISVTYLLNNGTNGIILSPQDNDFVFMTDVIDMNGESVNMGDLFDIVVHKQINFASNGESESFTKMVMPYISRNFVLATPSQYIFTLRRLNMFSKINVYNTLSDTNYINDNKLYLFLVPKITNYFTSSINYFNLPIDAFYLDDEEKDKVITYIRKMGNISTNTVLEIIQPTISKYVIHVFIRKYYGNSDESLKDKIISAISIYLANLDRDDRIVRSDIISTVEAIDGIDSVDLRFVSKKNEDYHKLKPNSTLIYGLDNILGDIIVNNDELAVVRGGWTDRNGVYYNEDISGNGFSPINITFVGTTVKNINMT